MRAYACVYAFLGRCKNNCGDMYVCTSVCVNMCIVAS